MGAGPCCAARAANAPARGHQLAHSMTPAHTGGTSPTSPKRVLARAGACTGEPAVSNTFADISAVYKLLVEHYRTPPSRIVLYGQSVGSGPTVGFMAFFLAFRAWHAFGTRLLACTLYIHCCLLLHCLPAVLAWLPHARPGRGRATQPAAQRHAGAVPNAQVVACVGRCVPQPPVRAQNHVPGAGHAREWRPRWIGAG